MGNALRFLSGHCGKPSTDSDYQPGVSALAHDLYNFEITSQVPQGLSKRVVSSKKAQANWYKKLSDAWRETKPPPKTPEEASRLVIQTLKRHQKADVEGLLAFYGLPLPHSLVELTSDGAPPSHPQGLKFELHTLPVDAKAVADGDTVTVYVSTTDPRESSCLPRDVQAAAIQRSKARAQKNYQKADELHRQIIDSGYRVIPVNHEEVLARKYRIRLRGIDAPESTMPYGKEAKEELTKVVQGKSLRVLVFDQDRYGRSVGDIYCNGIFAQVWPGELTKVVQGKNLRVLVFDQDRYGRSVGDIYCNGIFAQEVMLKKGLAWHYATYDKRPEFGKWEKEARAKRIGLWAARNPEMPWEWRKQKRENQCS